MAVLLFFLGGWGDSRSVGGWASVNGVLGSRGYLSLREIGDQEDEREELKTELRGKQQKEGLAQFRELLRQLKN